MCICSEDDFGCLLISYMQLSNGLFLNAHRSLRHPVLHICEVKIRSNGKELPFLCFLFKCMGFEKGLVWHFTGLAES